MVKDGLQAAECLLSPVKQDSKIKEIQDKVAQTLLNLNSISYSKHEADVKISEELRELILQSQLSNFQNINELLLEMLNQNQKLISSNRGLQDPEEVSDFGQNFRSQIEKYDLERKQKKSLRNHLAQMNQ